MIKNKERPSTKQISVLFTSPGTMFLFCSFCACEPEGNLLLMNIIKTNESRFLLWYKQLVISHEDSIIVDFHLVMLIIEKKKKRLRVKLSLAFCLSSVLRPMERHVLSDALHPFDEPACQRMMLLSLCPLCLPVCLHTRLSVLTCLSTCQLADEATEACMFMYGVH